MIGERKKNELELEENKLSLLITTYFSVPRNNASHHNHFGRFQSKNEGKYGEVLAK